MNPHHMSNSIKLDSNEGIGGVNAPNTITTATARGLDLLGLPHLVHFLLGGNYGLIRIDINLAVAGEAMFAERTGRSKNTRTIVVAVEIKMLDLMIASSCHRPPPHPYIHTYAYIHPYAHSTLTTSSPRWSPRWHPPCPGGSRCTCGGASTRHRPGHEYASSFAPSSSRYQRTDEIPRRWR